MQFYCGSKGFYKKFFKSALAILVLQLLMAATAVPAWAAKVTLIWNANAETDIGGYKLYYGNSSGNYQASVSVGSQNFYTLTGLVAGQTYYFAVTALDIAGNESPRSIELGGITINSGPSHATDSDNDGLSDDQEAEFGTNAHLADTDGDGISDGQELIDGTNPLDEGSRIEPLDTTLCSEWNGFLGGMWNVLELSNMHSSRINAQVKMYDNQSNLQQVYNVSIAGNGQEDILVHDFSDRVTDAYGKVCVEFNGNAGDLDGRMVYYKGERPYARSTKAFQFAFAMPFSSGLKGEQYVPFNTFHPSMDYRDIGNLVANWIQLTNISESRVNGTLKFYDLKGVLINSESLSIKAGARIDVSAHEYGADNVGLVKWSPATNDSKIQMRNVRYVFDNPYQVASFDTATQLSSQYGTGEVITVPLDTRGSSSIIELANVLNSTVKVDVYIYNSAGIEQFYEQIVLKANSQSHIITDEVLGLGTRGVAVIKANKASSIIATAMHYARDVEGGMKYMYGIPAQQALGAVMRSSYNTFLEQDSEVILTNPTSIDQVVNIDIVRSTGEAVAIGVTVTVPAHGMKAVRVNDYEMPNNYGVVTVQPQIINSVVAWIVRKRDGEYAMPIPVKP